MKFDKIPFRAPTKRPEPHGNYVWTFRERDKLITNPGHPYCIPTKLSTIKTSTLKDMLTTVKGWSRLEERDNLSSGEWVRIFENLISYRESIGRHE